MHVVIAVLHRPVQPTGVCRHAANLASCLAERPEITRVTLLTGAWQRDYFETSFGLISPKIAIHGIAIENRVVARNAWYLFGLPRLARRLRADIVHLSFPLPVLRPAFTCPVVATVHDLYPFEFPENFGRGAVFNRLQFRICAAQSDALISISQQTLLQLRRFFPRSAARRKVAVVYNYVDFSGLVPKRPAAWAAGRPFLLTVAQHRRNKNLDLLIRTQAALQRQGRIDQGLDLVIVGTEGPETANLHRLVDTCGLTGRVHFLASISDAELCWLYRAAALFAICSSAEGFCAPLVEALQNGSKVVCSDIPILREIAGDDECSFFELGETAEASLAGALERTLAGSEPGRPRGLRFAKSTAAQGYIACYTALREHR